MKILVTNDDGIKCPNLKILVEHLTKYYDEIMVIAPTTEQSAVSHKINIANPITLIEHEDIIKGVKTYSIDSTPADCVKFAIHHFNYDFDIVFSGFNNGLNLGEDITYSGTVAAVTEAMFYGKRGVATSSERGNLQGFIDGFDLFMKEYLSKDIYTKYNCFNVNFPVNPKGIKYTYPGSNKYKYWFEPINKNTFIPKALPLFQKEGKEDIYTDLECYHNGYITITPITSDMTNYEILKQMNHK